MVVVAGVDESPAAVRVVERAIDEAAWRKAELHLVHVSHIPVLYGEIAVDWTDVIEGQRAATWGGLAGVISAATVPIERVELSGYPPDVLVAYCRANHADLLVVGTRGRGDFASLILGSTSHRALHLSACDVLVVKTHGEAQAGADSANA